MEATFPKTNFAVNYLRDFVALKPRPYQFVDALRGIFVLLMVVRHFIYDLRVFGHIEQDSLLAQFSPGNSIGSTFGFIFIGGVSIAMAYGSGMDWPRYLKREGKIIGAAIIVSCATYIAYNGSWVYSGILHFFSLAFVAALLFINRPWISLVIGLAILIPFLGFGYKYPWFTLSHRAFDYVAFLPWFGFMLLGIFAHHLGFHKIMYGKQFPIILVFVGQKSLPIYLLHLPLFFGFFELLRYFR